MKVLSTLNFGSFPGKLMFSAGYTFDEVCRELNKQKCPEWLQAFKECEYLAIPACAGFASKRYIHIKGKEYEYNFVFMRDVFDFSDQSHSYLSHEVIHICTFQLSPMLNIVKETEAFAYTHTHILTQCYKVIRDARKKKK